MLQARTQGAAASRDGKQSGANPYRGNTPLVRQLSRAWLAGWNDEHALQRARRGAR